MKYCYIVVEGQHDIEVLIKLIKKLNLSVIKQRSLVDSFWDALIPNIFPINDDLLKRVPVPRFLQNDEYSIAIHSARGIENIAQTLEESLFVLEVTQLYSIGLILDADDTELPSKRFQQLKDLLSNKLSFMDVELAQLGAVKTVNQNQQKLGVFIIPNNQDSGTLEDILIECAKCNYNNLFELAEKYIRDMNRDDLKKSDLKELKKPAGEKKAKISIISSVLKPGKTIQVSIQDNRWIDEKSLQLPMLINLRDFIADLLGV
ncbi:hypothetical protein PN462_21990 [Spirulina sp. CS-785/01]|uniref:DUF3226 domain-containing protein n=1 Tax=Spirulina sp. CS-785/01 TaxID=3021716 RepID=UPI00232B2441|nr:DUF3226 domain-containing protein [Spirulina sp. CS-785/01]MDB9315801.1 hypothetical protein [Spirulina sp. CS-785/01]